MYSNREIFEAFQSKLPQLSAEAQLKYRRTISEFEGFVALHSLKLGELSETHVADWTVELLRRGLSRATVCRHLDILSSLLAGAADRGLVAAVVSPRAVAASLRSPGFILPPLMDEAVFGRVLSRLRSLLEGRREYSVADDVLLFSLLNGALPLGTVAALTKDAAKSYAGASRSLLDRNMAPGRKFVFGLRQSYVTPRRLLSALGEELSSRFGDLLPGTSPDADTLSRSLWTACAVRCGATASEALSLAGGSAPYAIPSVCEPSGAVSSGGNPWMEPVVRQLTQGEPGWYAMHLRRGVSYEELRREIVEHVRPVPELFYPVESMPRSATGGATVSERPFISRTVFFKSRPEHVLPMFSVIGDKAWCFRVANRPESPYAVIPPSEMARFQGAIGVFTPDTKIYPLGGLIPRPGERVIVIQAGYGDREGEVEKIVGGECGSAIFRVRLTTDYGYEWRVDIDSRRLQSVIDRGK